MSGLIWIKLIDTLMELLKEFLKKSWFWKKSADDKKVQNDPVGRELTLKAPTTTAADDNFCEIFSNFRKK